MSFNIGGMLGGAATGFLTGGPWGAALGGLGGALSGGGGNATAGLGGVINGGYTQLNNATELNQFALDTEQARHNEQMQWQSNAFNEMMDNRSEHMRESNELRSLAMEQRKVDNGVTKEFIKSIGE